MIIIDALIIIVLLFKKKIVHILIISITHQWSVKSLKNRKLNIDVDENIKEYNSEWKKTYGRISYLFTLHKSV